MIIERPLDRISMRCPKCHGEKRIKRYVLQSYRPLLFATQDEHCMADDKIHVEDVDCSACDGTGSVTPEDGDRAPIYQRGELIGYCTVPPKLRTSFLVVMRPGDYTPRANEDGMYYDADPSLSPGDFEYLIGFNRYS